MDNIDVSILRLLEINGRVTASEISKKVGLSVPSVLDRIHKMENNKIIDKYTIRLNRGKFNGGLLALVCVIVEQSGHQQTFIDAIMDQPNVLECHHIAGEYNYLLKIAVEDMVAFNRFVYGTLLGMNGVSRFNTMIVLDTVKEELNLGL